MRTRELERFKKLLLVMRTDLQREWDSFEKEKLSKNLRDQLGQVSSFTTHPADMGSITDEQERAFLLAGHEKMLLNAIDKALMRIEKKTYGKCLGCGKLIEKKRLLAIPYTDFCLLCQEQLEEDEASKGLTV